MCTAISMGRFFGRTLDYDRSFGEEVVFMPRNFPLSFRHEPGIAHHNAVLGMAHVQDGYPLYYDAVNENGLYMAGLNYVHSCRYGNPGTHRIAAFELIPWVLGQCGDLAQARALLSDTAILGDDFSDTLPCARLHWMIADRTGAVVAEPMHDGLKIYENPFGVMTNAPDFPYHINRLSELMNVSPYPPKNRIFPSAELVSYSRGSGAFGTPGDFSSASRFIRAAFASAHTAHGKTKSDEISRFFHIMDTVAQPSGCAVTEEGKPISTVYTSCADTETATYYFTTYGCRRIRSVALKNAALDSDKLISYPMECREDILYL